VEQLGIPSVQLQLSHFIERKGQKSLHDLYPKDRLKKMKNKIKVLALQLYGN